MKKLIALILIFVLVLSVTGCTAQERAKNYGGQYTLELDPGEKLVNITWKEDTLWYLVREMTEEDIAESYTFKSDSSYGIFEGTVYVKETK